jgi:uncharacterized YigZ family protein
MPETDTYLTIAAPVQSLYKEKGSKFIGLAYPVQDENQIKDILTSLRKEYFDARHHCYAYMLGATQSIYRANDDGEPNHSAGDPILGQIRSHNLTYILVVVVRYFGGTKLGVSGLINAYKTATTDALAAARIIEKIVQVALTLRFTYLQMNAVMKLVKEYVLEIIYQDFGNECQMDVWVRQRLVAEVQTRLAQAGVLVTETKNG